MDWFERLTGFREESYAATRAKLKVEGRHLRSLVNGKSHGIGEFELPSLRTLRERAARQTGTPGRLKVSVVTGDVREMPFRETLGLFGCAGDPLVDRPQPGDGLVHRGVQPTVIPARLGLDRGVDVQMR
jgi:hypothetical protein